MLHAWPHEGRFDLQGCQDLNAALQYLVQQRIFLLPCGPEIIKVLK